MIIEPIWYCTSLQDDKHLAQHIQGSNASAGDSSSSSAARSTPRVPIRELAKDLAILSARLSCVATLPRYGE